MLSATQGIAGGGERDRHRGEWEPPGCIYVLRAEDGKRTILRKSRSSLIQIYFFHVESARPLHRSCHAAKSLVTNLAKNDPEPHGLHGGQAPLDLENCLISMPIDHNCVELGYSPTVEYNIPCIEATFERALSKSSAYYPGSLAKRWH